MTLALQFVILHTNTDCLTQLATDIALILSYLNLHMQILVLT